jgi:hypothetical protein
LVDPRRTSSSPAIITYMPRIKRPMLVAAAPCWPASHAPPSLPPSPVLRIDVVLIAQPLPPLDASVRALAVIAIGETLRLPPR